MTCWGSPALIRGLLHDFQEMAENKRCTGSIGPLKSSPNRVCALLPSKPSPHPLYSIYLSPPQIHCTKTLSSTILLKPKSKLASHRLHSAYSVLTLLLYVVLYAFFFQNTNYLRNCSMHFFFPCAL